jgi:tRNA 2-selenouridine synthase
MQSIIDILESIKPIIDVRTPAEFAQGHIPNAQNIPLFTNEERHEVGLCYKQKGKDAAVKLGLKYVGPKLELFVESAEHFSQNKQAIIHCWRGGMRSQSMAWLLKTSGFETQIIEGGYKAFRNVVLNQFKEPHSLISLGGYTGSGKTEILHALRGLGEPIIDLEGIANHKGSAFGIMGDQPSSEHFENTVATELIGHKNQGPIWIEDESRNIGKVYLNNDLKNLMNASPLVVIDKPNDLRIEGLCEDYGKVPIASLTEDFKKIEKRLGGQHVKAAIKYLENDDLASACAIALHYYDKSYEHALQRSSRDPHLTLSIGHLSNMEVAKQLIEWKNLNLLNSATALDVDAK